MAALVEAFHAVHDRVYAVRDEGSQVECVNWRGRLSVTLAAPPLPAEDVASAHLPAPHSRRPAYFGDGAMVEAPVFRGAALRPGAVVAGPAIIEEPTTTVVVYPGMRAGVSAAGNYVLQC